MIILIIYSFLVAILHSLCFSANHSWLALGTCVDISDGLVWVDGIAGEGLQQN